MRKGMLTVAICAWALVGRADEGVVEFRTNGNELQCAVDGQKFFSYFTRDEKTPRPFLAHVFAPGGVQVTRNHPPVEGRDLTDHDTFHPGIWLAFGDLSGADSWRVQEPIVQKMLSVTPERGGRGEFEVAQQYMHGERVLCDERCRRTVVVRPWGWLLIWDSTFRPSIDEIVFGDQEEMGLGVRMATPLIVKNGGTIVNSAGLKNEEQAWGKQADWCEYSGTIDGRRVGIVMMADPKNFRRSWWHARDYGLLEANPFGRKAFTGGEESRVVLRRDETLRLRFGVLVFNEDPQAPFDRSAAYTDFLAQLDDEGSAAE